MSINDILMSVKECTMTQLSLDTIGLESSHEAAVWKDPILKYESGNLIVSFSFLDCYCSLSEENGNVG